MNYGVPVYQDHYKAMVLVFFSFGELASGPAGTLAFVPEKPLVQGRNTWEVFSCVFESKKTFVLNLI